MARICIVEDEPIIGFGLKMLIKEYKRLFPVLDKMLSLREAALISFTHFEQWIDQLEEAIWIMDKVRVDVLLEEGKRELCI